MKRCPMKISFGLLCTGFLVLGLLACAGVESMPKATLQVVPEKTVLTPDLLKQPIEFKGSGFKAKELVVVDLLIPKGIKIKTVPEDEEAVGLAFANADEKGGFSSKMGPTATLNWFFQVRWTEEGKPDFKEAKPLPAGKYQIRATGMDSEAIGTATLEILPPPEKK